MSDEAAASQYQVLEELGSQYYLDNASELLLTYCRWQFWGCLQGNREGHWRDCGNQACMADPSLPVFTLLTRIRLTSSPVRTISKKFNKKYLC